jgi:enamine deaminase RidA (YjgF/YER057c/UK114 family)
MPTQFLNPPGLAPTNGWTQVVTSTGGKTIYVSGQVSVDERGHQPPEAHDRHRGGRGEAGETSRGVHRLG